MLPTLPTHPLQRSGVVFLNFLAPVTDFSQPAALEGVPPGGITTTARLTMRGGAGRAERRGCWLFL